jgi:hypothetical protein
MNRTGETVIVVVVIAGFGIGFLSCVESAQHAEQIQCEAAGGEYVIGRPNFCVAKGTIIRPRKKL